MKENGLTVLRYTDWLKSSDYADWVAKQAQKKEEKIVQEKEAARAEGGQKRWFSGESDIVIDDEN
jgi:hypothetical protein